MLSEFGFYESRKSTFSKIANVVARLTLYNLNMKIGITISAIAIAAVTVTAFYAFFVGIGSSGNSEQQIKALCDSRPASSLASQTDRSWYAEYCSNLD